MKTTTTIVLKKHFIIGCLFIVFYGFSQPFSSANPTICGDNTTIPVNIDGYSKFTLSSDIPVSAYIDSGCTITYASQTTATVFLKPDLNQLDATTFNISLAANSASGLLVKQVITVTNYTKVWKGESSTDWNNPANWSPKGVPTAANCVIIPTKTVISGTNLNAFAKNIVVKPSGSCEIQSGNNLTVNEWINVNNGGLLNVKNNASIIQINDDQNSGKVNIEKITQPMSYYDYTYWNSPLTAASNFTLANLSPLTKTDIWSFNPTISGGSGNWTSESCSSVMLPNKGYIVKAPDTFSTNTALKTNYTANFIGTPNNGTLVAPISKGTNANMGGYIKDEDDEWNLIGNPYPSGIDAKKFLENQANTNVIEGTIYIWTNNPQPTAAYKDQFYGDYVLNYTTQDYASFNKTGSTGTCSTGTSAPSGYIASGSSFFVKAAKTMANGTTANVTFNNTMRTTEFNVDTNNTNAVKKVVSEEKHRIWLNLTNNSGAFSQTLVGYITGATQDLDSGFDGESFGGNDVTFYSVIPQAKLAIQGRALPFDQNDVVALGYKAAKRGNYSIRIDHLDGVLENQKVILVDKELNITQDLNSSPYVFNTKVGEFNDRFAIRYENKTLNIVDNKMNEDSILISYATKNNIVNINNKLIDMPVENVSLFDILGQTIDTWKIENQEQTNISIPIKNLPSGIYIVKVKTSEGESSKKIIVS